MAHEPLTALEQDDLVWISRFADRLRLQDARFAEEGASEEANEIARGAWERLGPQAPEPEAAADDWLAQRSRP